MQADAPIARGATGEIVVLDRRAVASILTTEDCIAVVEAALARLAAGEGQQPVRESLTSLGGKGVLALMPAELVAPGILGYKAVTVFPGNRELGYPSHQASISLIDPENGRLVAVVDGTEITEIRTAAVSAVATRHLARTDATHLAILGTGAQARAHVHAIPLVRPIERISIWGRRSGEAERVAHEEHNTAGPAITAATTVENAVRHADVIVTATSSSEPILRGEAVRPGAHINAVGSCFPHTRELSGDLVAAASVFVDDRAAARVEAGDLLLAERDGLIGPDHPRGVLGDVVRGAAQGRTHPEEITIFESLGLGVEDIAVAAFVVERAIERGLGARMAI